MQCTAQKRERQLRNPTRNPTTRPRTPLIEPPSAPIDHSTESDHPLAIESAEHIKLHALPTKSIEVLSARYSQLMAMKEGVPPSLQPFLTKQKQSQKKKVCCHARVG